MPDSLEAKSCRLCGTSSVLQRSHIIPDFGYRKTINPKGHPRMIVVRSGMDQMVSKKQQTGHWEYLLCKACEAKMSVWETYAANTLFAEPPEGQDPPAVIHGLEYAPLKLFFLSFLWKASVSSHRSFRALNLGTHEEVIRKMLIEENPGRSLDYGCLVMRLLPEPIYDASRTVFDPGNVSNGGDAGALFCFHGLAFNFYLETRTADVAVLAAFLATDGSMVVLPIKIGMIEPLRRVWDAGITTIQSQP